MFVVLADLAYRASAKQNNPEVFWKDDKGYIRRSNNQRDYSQHNAMQTYANRNKLEKKNHPRQHHHSSKIHIRCFYGDSECGEVENEGCGRYFIAGSASTLIRNSVENASTCACDRKGMSLGVTDRERSAWLH